MAWVIDLDGVVWEGEHPIPGSVAALNRLHTAGEDIWFVTNFSYLPVADQEARLRSHGITCAEGRVRTAAQAAARLVGAGERVLCCAGPGVIAAVEAVGATALPGTSTAPVDAVIVGFHPEFDFARLTAAARAVRAGARLLATNPDHALPTPEGLLPGAGALVAAVEVASGAKAVVAGKPFEPMAELLREELGEGATGVVVGDRLDTDGSFAHRMGLHFVLVRTGVHSGDGVDPEIEVADDLASAVDAWLANARESPA